MVTKKSWDEFRNTGLLLFINSILHVFGWAIVVDVENDKVIDAYPARVKFRGFDEKSVEDSHIKIADYLKNNINELNQEVNVDNNSSSGNN